MDITVPVVRGCYKNSIEFPIPFDADDPSAGGKEKLKFPDLGFDVEADSTDSQKQSTKFIEDFQSHISFDLESDARDLLIMMHGVSESEKKTFRNLLSTKTKTFTREERSSSIQRYRQKKANRKMTYQIRYKVRQDLAVKRLRNKGKFIKSKKLDIRAVADMIMKNDQERLAGKASEIWK